MSDAISRNRAHWDEVTPVHVASPFYEVEAFRRGEAGLDRLAAEGVGEVAGLKLLHLQCHIGLDTLSLARMGAEVTGLDFSAPAIDTARRLAADIGVSARFVQSDVLEAPADLTGFDRVFTTWGAICWIGDLASWMRVAARALKPGGQLFLMEGHPAMLMMDDRAAPGAPFTVAYPYDSPDAIVDEGGRDYADPDAKIEHARTMQWMHGMGRILTAALDAGLEIRRFVELDRIPWKGLPQLVPVEKGYWGLPPGTPPFPLAFQLLAQKR
jgi:SAM-dependent methyltransferase